MAIQKIVTAPIKWFIKLLLWPIKFLIKIVGQMIAFTLSIVIFIGLIGVALMVAGFVPAPEAVPVDEIESVARTVYDAAVDLVGSADEYSDTISNLI